MAKDSLVNGSALPVRKAPPVTANVYEEIIPSLYESQLIYCFAEVVKSARTKEIDLTLPDNFPIETLKEFEKESIDLRKKCFNDGNGLSLGQLFDLLQANREAVLSVETSEFGNDVVQELKAFFASPAGAGQHDKVFLSTFRSISQDVSIVYAIMKDTYNKKICISFRGSANFNDWLGNLDAKLANMKTPDRIQDKMEGILRERVLVHNGFYEFLFENDDLKDRDKEQRYQKILDDIRPLMEDGYSVYVSGHSLGGALAHILTLALAGDGAVAEWLPLPVTCISFAAPFSGTDGYRSAYEQSERDGLIRCLRVTNDRDLVPTIPFASIGFRFRTMKHVGINLRLWPGGMRFSHSSESGFWSAVDNSIFKPFWSAKTAHLLPFYDKLIEEQQEVLETTFLDELYKNQSVVSEDFLASEETANNEL